MSPWDIIGWTIILAVVIAVGSSLLWATSAWTKHKVRSLLDRRVPVAAGQVWEQDGTHLTIREVYENGRIGIRTGDRISGASWSDDPDEWERRKRQRNLTLVRRG